MLQPSDNNTSDDVASRTRSKMTIKARNERARLDKAQKRSFPLVV